MKWKDINPDDRHAIYNEINKEVQKHTVPSPGTNKMFKSMQKEITESKIDRAIMKKDIEYIKEKMDIFIASADKKYASKLTQKIVYAAAGLVLVGFFGFLISTSFK